MQAPPWLKTLEGLALVALDDALGLRELLAEKGTHQLSRQALALREALEAGDDLACPDVDEDMPVPTAVHRRTVLCTRKRGEWWTGVTRYRDRLPTFQSDREAAPVPAQGNRLARPGAVVQVSVNRLGDPDSDRHASTVCRPFPPRALVNVGSDTEHGDFHRSPHDFRTPNDFQRRQISRAFSNSGAGPVMSKGHALSQARSQAANSSAACRQRPCRGRVSLAI